MHEPSLARGGAAAALVGALVLLAATLLHPLEADPSDAAAAFAEYAAAPLWGLIHLGQFLGACASGAALVLLARTLRAGRGSAWAALGQAGAIASVATAAVLQAVDGVALKAMVDRWAAAPLAAQAASFEAAFAVRQIEIGLASLASLLFGLTVMAYGIALILSGRQPRWLGWLGLLAGLATAVSGLAQAATGFSPLAMAISMPASALMLGWLLAVGIVLWRHAGRLAARAAP